MATTRYIWDYASDAYLMEKDETGATTAVYTNEPVQYGNLVSQRRDGATKYHHFDGQGSTRELTNSAQEVTDDYEHKAFGGVIAESGTTTNPFGYKGYTGYYANPTCRVDYVRARTYGTETGRWLTPDPLGFAAGDIDLYRYVANSPVNAIDPSGLWVRCTTICTYPAPGAASTIQCKVVASATDCRGNRFCTTTAIPMSAGPHGPLVRSDAKPCASLNAAIAMVNALINGGGKCQDWFDRSGGLMPNGYNNVCGPFGVAVHSFKIPCWFGIPVYTFPGARRLGVCGSHACCMSAKELASLLIHELAHHYCTIGPGRETCAIAAQDDCADELIQLA